MSVPAEIPIYERGPGTSIEVLCLLPACQTLFVKYDLIYWVWARTLTNDSDNMRLCTAAYLH